MNTHKSRQLTTVLAIAILALLGTILYIYYTTRDLTQRIATIETTARKEALESKGAGAASDELQPTVWGQMQPRLNNTVAQVFSQAAEADLLQPYKAPYQAQYTGSAFFINADGELVTNAHVVDQARAVWIQIPGLGKRQIDVDVVGIAPESDLALLRVRPEGIELIKRELGNVPYLELGDSDNVRRADETMALGYPLSQQGLKSTTGVVSGREQHLIQISSPINPGSSGGPSINTRGQVIGVNSSGVFGGAQNVGYAIPINDLKVILNDLRKNTLVRKPYLGMFYNPSSEALTEFLGNPQPGGLYVVEVHKGSPLDKAGVKPGDMVYEINGYPVDIFGEMTIPPLEDKVSVVDYVSRLSLGQPVHLVVYRKGKRMEINLTFDASKPLSIARVFPGYDQIDYEIVGGMLLQQLTLNHLPLLVNAAPGLTRYAESKYQSEPAIIITHIFPDSQAQRSRTLAPGHIVTKVNGQSVGTLADARSALLKSVNSGYLTVETSDSRLVVFPLSKVITEEPKLARDYFYTITPGVRELLNKIGSIKQNEQEPVQQQENPREQPASPLGVAAPTPLNPMPMNILPTEEVEN